MKQIALASLSEVLGGAARDPIGCGRQKNVSTVAGGILGGVLGRLAAPRRRLVGTLLGAASLGTVGRLEAAATHPGCAPAP